MTSVITPSFGLMRGTNVHAREGVPSGRERFPIRLGIIEEGHRLEPVAACPALPEIRRAARAGFNPVRGADRLAALGAGIFVGQIAEVCSGHGATPFCFSWKTNWTGLLSDTRAPAARDCWIALSLLNGDEGDHG